MTARGSIPYLCLLALGACDVPAASPGVPADPGAMDDAGRGPIGKADSAGSCQEACGGQSQTGRCYCDALCLDYGDCCGDYELTCTASDCEPTASFALGVTWNGALGREEIHTVDLATMQHEFLAVIDGVAVTGTNFNDPFARVIYVAGRESGAGEFRLLAIDASTGDVLSNPILPELEFDEHGSILGGFNFGGGLHPQQGGSAVGVTWNGEDNREEIHTVDLSTMQHEFLAEIPGVQRTGGHFNDAFSGRVYVRGGDEGGDRLFALDAVSGAVLSNPVMPVLTFDDESGETTGGFNFGGGFHVMSDGTTVGVTWNGQLQREEIHTVDLATLSHDMLAVLPGIRWTSGQFADPFSGRVYVNARGDDDDDGRRLFAIQASTGAILSNPLLPQLQFDDATGEIVGGFNFGGGLHVMAPTVCPGKDSP